MSAVTLQALPHDILHLVLRALPDLHSLHAVQCTSKVFPQLVRQSPNGIYSRIALQEFSPDALQLLRLAGKGAMHDFARKVLSEGTSGWFGSEMEGAESASEAGLKMAEVKRLVQDRNKVEMLVDWVGGVLSEAPVCGSKTVDGVAVPLFDMAKGSGFSESERTRVRSAIYLALQQAPHMHCALLAGSPTGTVSRREINSSEQRVVFDYSSLLALPFPQLMHLLALADTLAKLPFFARLSTLLTPFMWARAYDPRKVYSDQAYEMEYTVEYIRRGGLKDRWQGELEELSEDLRKEKGFRGGWDRTRFEEREIWVEGKDGAEKKMAVVEVGR